MNHIVGRDNKEQKWNKNIEQTNQKSLLEEHERTKTSSSQLKRIPRDCKNSSYFLQFAFNVSSQGGEDGIIKKIFSYIHSQNQNSKDEQRFYCVDIGAWDGEHLSNTFNLLQEDRRWSGLLVEANSERVEKMKRLYKGNKHVSAVCRLVSFEGPNALRHLLDEYHVPHDMDFLSIDIDGADYHLWSSLAESPYRAKLVCIEFNPTIQNHIHFVQAKSMAVHQGSSLRALMELGHNMGYQLVATTTFNAFFVRNDCLLHFPFDVLTKLFPLRLNVTDSVTISRLPATEEALDKKSVEDWLRDHLDGYEVDLDQFHSASMCSDLFQTYDGELHLAGPKKLLWHRLAINIQSLQPIKQKKRRIFPFAPPAEEPLDQLQAAVLRLTCRLVRLMHLASSESTESFNSRLPQKEMLETVEAIHLCRDFQPFLVLEGLFADLLLNLVLTLVMTRQYLKEAFLSDTGDVTLELDRGLAEFIAEIAMAMEAQGCVELKSQPSDAGLHRAKAWFRRCFYLLDCLRDAPGMVTITLADRSIEELQAQLASSISGCCLRSPNNLLISLLKGKRWEDKAIAENTLAEVSFQLDTGNINIEELMEGLYWLRISQSLSPKTPNVAPVPTLTSLYKRWSEKLGMPLHNSDSLPEPNHNNEPAYSGTWIGALLFDHLMRQQSQLRDTRGHESMSPLRWLPLVHENQRLMDENRQLRDRIEEIQSLSRPKSPTTAPPPPSQQVRRGLLLALLPALYIAKLIVSQLDK